MFDRITKFSLASLLLIGVVLLSAMSQAAAAIVIVTNLNDSGTGSLRAAIDNSASGDSIGFTVTGTIGLTSDELYISHNLTVTGPAGGSITVSGNNSLRVFSIQSGVTVTLSNLTISNGSGGIGYPQGGGIYNQGTLSLRDCVVTTNRAPDPAMGTPGEGGAIYNDGTLDLTRCALTNNSAQSAGGAIYNAPNRHLTATKCSFVGNKTEPTVVNYGGAGIYNSDTAVATLTNSTFSGNTASGDGGAIYNFGTVTMSDCTVAGNSTNTYGGGISEHHSGALTITNCTITNNAAPDTTGSGIYLRDATSLTIANSIVARNVKPVGGTNDITIVQSAVITNQGHNLIGDITGSANSWGATDLTGTQSMPFDPKFDPAGLKNNGGPTMTVALQADSPAIDHGVSPAITTDQRGRARPYDDPATTNANGTDGSDIGAFEVGPSPAAVTNLNDSGPGSLRDSLSDHFFGDVITLEASLGSTMTLLTPLQLNKELTIAGPGRGRIAIDGNNATRVIDIISAEVTLSGLTISGGSDSGIRLHGTSSRRAIATLENCTIANNNGSGVFNEAFCTLNVRGSTFADNQANSGGAISNGGVLLISDSTLTRNTAANGAAILLTAQTEIQNSTISGNTATNIGGGIYHQSGSLKLSSNIIAGNTAANTNPDVYSQAGVTSSNYDFIGVGTGVSGFQDGTNHDQVGTSATPKNPKLGPLQDNGGPTFTMALLTGSTAIDKGLADGLTTDQRGSLRTYDQPGAPNETDATDIGAFELLPLPIVTTDAATNIGTNSATLNASVNPNGFATTAHFEYGTTTSYGSVTADQAIPSGTATISINAAATGLGVATIYHFRIAATSAGGTAAGEDMTFTTAPLSTPTPTPTPTPTFTPTPTPTPTATPIPATLANISTRLRVETGDNALIGGFIVTGTQDKKVIIRAIGPSLGLADQLANPTLELYSGSTLLKANDNWVDSPDKQAIIDSTIPPTNDLESAIVATLPANGATYTAIVRGVSNTTGIGLVEIYDLDRSVDSKLANISTRGLVQTGDNVLIAGTIVLGQASQKVIIRAIGPSLSIAGKLLDPTLQLVNANGTELAFNDNWRTGGQEADIIATTVPPTNDLESAIVYDLPANGANYTAIVRGAGGTTGIAVVEIYALK